MGQIVQAWIIQTEQAERAARSVEETIAGSSKRAEAAVAGVDQAYQRAGRSAERAMGNTQAALRTATKVAGAFGLGVSAAAAGAERSFVSLAATVISSFAIGGPVMGAITAVAGGIGLLVGQSKEGSEAARVHAAQLQKLGEIEERNAALRRTLGFIAGRGREPTEAEQELLALQEKRLDVIRQQVEFEATARPGLDTAERRAGLERQLDVTNDLMRAARVTVGLERQQAAALEEQKRIRSEIAAHVLAENAAMIARSTGRLGGAESSLASTRAFVEGLRGAVPAAQQLEERLAAVRGEMESNNRILAEFDKLQIVGNATLEESVSLHIRRHQVMEEEIRVLERGRQNLPAQKGPIEAFLEGPSKEQQVVAFAQQASGIVQGSLSDAITDGIFEGFKNGGDIVDAFGQRLVQTFLNAMLEATIGDATRSLFTSVGKAITGYQFGGLVTRPSIISVAEREPEYVLRPRDVQQMLRAAGGGGGGGRIDVRLVIDQKGAQALTGLGLMEDHVDFMRGTIRSPRNVAEARGIY